jgi:hypothetical protein
MAKKNWIFIKRGLSEDPKHREAMQMAVWLFMHICDAADWEKGIVYDWRDNEIAVDMSLSTTTVRGWRDRLIKLGYITCKRKQYGLDIVIHNWTNPRDYGGKKINVIKSDTTMSISDEDDNPDCAQIDPQIDPQIDGQMPNETRANDVPFIESSSSSLSSSSSRRRNKIISAATASISIKTEYMQAEVFANKAFQAATGMVTFPAKDKDPAIQAIESLRDKYKTVPEMAEYLKPYFRGWLDRKYSRSNLAWLTDWAVCGEIPTGKKSEEPVKVYRDPMRTYNEWMERQQNEKSV